ncbi:MAG: Sec-dependent nitrous-oxide reductase [Candidatus Omnitrophica bacterium]|nr:Sec-dependent nitrous-oxide reductase [Candidatus Omnitrophota bacterium]MBI2105031.1 Sec-dependent nitrous-oxide reductase [Candidatus Omnitrophota bacterium]
MNRSKRIGVWLGILAVGALAVALIRGPAPRKAADQPAAPAGLPGDAAEVIRARTLSPSDVTAALATYTPTGRYDEYVMFASGGHSGQVLAIGLPSMRLLRVIAAFTPESWQGYGYGVKENPLTALSSSRTPEKAALTWADTHHPALSETNGDYDGEYLFIGDKANGRMVVIDLRDFESKQIVDNPVFFNNHGAAFVTPNTEYVVEGSQYAMPLGGEYAPLAQYQERYRGLMTFWKFDRAAGRILPEQSFAVELPPYWQDLADAGKLVSDGWVFVNSFNTEMATGGIEEGNPPFEAGTSQRDTDYLHLINWKKAEQAVASGKAETIKGLRVVPLKTAVEEGILYFVAEPKSPHGVDVCPEGKHLVVAGKLDPHVTIFNFERILGAIEQRDFEGQDPYGVPILRFDAVKEAQVELGLGPLHTQFDNKGYAYTSLFLESAVARWTMGDCKYQAPEGPWKLAGKVPVHYNIGHLAVAGGDTVQPDGKYLVSLNKWSVDRFLNVGPLLPQNLQLVDITRPGEQMRLLYDMPIGIGEPHYAQIIKADKLKAWEVYPEVGWDTLQQAKSPNASYESKVVRDGRTVEVHMTAIRSHFDPEHIVVTEGDHVRLFITNLERTRDATHGFAIAGYNIAASIEPGETVTIEFDAKTQGVYPFYCLEFCSALHLEMTGYLLVQPGEARVASE